MVSFNELPHVILEEICSYLDGWSTQHLGASCTLLHAVTSEDRLWLKLLTRTGVRVVPPEVVKLCGANHRATFFLCHRLRRNWGSGGLRQVDILKVPARSRGGLGSFSANPSYLMSSSSSFSAMWGEEASMNEGVRGQKNIKIIPNHNQDTTVVEVPLSSKSRDIIALHVLEDFVVLLRGRAEADMLVFSIDNSKLLFIKEKLFNTNNFLRDHTMDTTKFENTLAAFRQYTISLYSVTVEDVETRVLGVLVAGLHGRLHLSRFLAVDNTHLAHPCWAMVEDGLAVCGLEYKVFCWHRDTWQQKQFVLQGKSKLDNVRLALHRGKLLTAQTTTFRQWDIQTGALEIETRRSLTIPNNLYITRIGLHIQPHLGLLVGMVIGYHGNLRMIKVVVCNLAWEVVATRVVTQGKNLPLLELHLVGPRVILLYSDNSYSCLDLETLDREPDDRTTGPSLQAGAPSPLPVFPLGSARLPPGTSILRDFGHVSQLGFVIGQLQGGVDHVQGFSTI